MRQLPVPHRPGPFLARDRAQEIADALHADASFHGHRTLDYNNEDVTNTFKHCAPALIVLEREERPNQMMRIGERLGFYDRTALVMDSPVPDTLDDLVAAHNNPGRRTSDD